MLDLASTIFAISAPLTLLFAAITITAVMSTTNQRNGATEDAIEILAKTTVWMFASAVVSLALAGFPLVFGYLTSAQ